MDPILEEYLKKKALGEQYTGEGSPMEPKMIGMDSEPNIDPSNTQPQQNQTDIQGLYQMLTKKYLSPENSMEARDKLMPKEPAGLGGLLGGLGQSLQAVAAAGGGKESYAQAMDRMNRAKLDAQDRALNQFDMRRKGLSEDMGVLQKANEFQRAGIKAGREDEDFATESNPNSQKSIMAQNLIKKMYPGMPVEGKSYRELSPFMGEAEKIYAQENANKRASMLASEKKAANQEKFDTQKEKQLVQLRTNLGDRINPARRNPLLTKLQTQVNQAEALEALALQHGKIENLNPQQMTEAARMLDSLLSQGGAGTVQITNELIPKSIGRNSAEVMQWLTNNPKGTNQQKFTNYLIRTARREKIVRENQVRAAQVQAAMPHRKSFQSMGAEDEWKDALLSAGIDPETDIDEKGRFIPKPVEAHGPLDVVQNVPKFKTGDVREKNGKKYQRQEDGTWLPL